MKEGWQYELKESSILLHTVVSINRFEIKEVTKYF